MGVCHIHNRKTRPFDALVPERLKGHTADDGAENCEGAPDTNDNCDNEENTAHGAVDIEEAEVLKEHLHLDTG